MRRTEAIAWVVSVCAVSLRRSQAETLAILVTAAMRCRRVSLANIGRAALGGARHRIDKWCRRFCANGRVEPADAPCGAWSGGSSGSARSRCRSPWTGWTSGSSRRSRPVPCSRAARSRGAGPHARGTSTTGTAPATRSRSRRRRRRRRRWCSARWPRGSRTAGRGSSSWPTAASAAPNWPASASTRASTTSSVSAPTCMSAAPATRASPWTTPRVRASASCCGRPTTAGTSRRP